MKALALFERWGKSRGNRRRQRGGWRRLAKSGLHVEPLEERRMLSVNAALLADLHNEGGSSPSDFIEAAGTTFFVAEDLLVGRELWKTDGTAEGTVAVKDIYPSGETQTIYEQGQQYLVDVRYSSNPQDLVAFNGKLYFTADHGVYGRELWISDGTAAGTQIVADLYTGEHSDGSEVVPNSSDPQDLTVVNGTLFFTATDGARGREVWMLNAATGVPVVLKDINPASTSGSSPQELTAADGTLVFTADDGTTGREVWISYVNAQGQYTAAGTIQLADIADGEAGSDPAFLTYFDETLYFAANDGVDGVELWRTDGAGGVEQVEDINPGAGGSNPSQLTVVNGTLYFTANNGADGTELWKTDGSGGVVQVEINDGPAGSNPAWLTDVDGTLFFAADDGTHGTELWKAEDAGGAGMVEDINADGASSNPSSLVAMNGALYFSADDGATGTELWVSDGTGDGTFLLADANDGAEGSAPATLTNVGGTLFFSADDGAAGQEPWTFAPAKLTIYINGQKETIPAQIGVEGDGNVSAIYTLDDSGTLLVSAVGDSPLPETITLAHFFDTWQNNAGNAGDRANAVFSSEQILGNSVDATHKIQVFVNGVANHDFENYAVQGGDEIAIVYTSNEVVSLNFNVGSVLVELLDGAAPGTVTNFLNYANDGDWVNTFVHRKMPDFVVQLGGFTTTHTYFGALSQFKDVTSGPYIANEFNLSNVRGTLAMAKLGFSPAPGVDSEDSATSQFFFNVSDNSANLDAQNGGFTVFARALNMDVVDVINAYSTRDLDAEDDLYDNVPFTGGGELVVMQSIGGEGEVHGVVFDDLDGDGVRDAGEAGREGVTLYIDKNNNGERDEGEFFTTSGSGGEYRFHYKSGQYLLRQELEPGAHRFQTSAPNGYSVSVQIGRETAGGSFGSVEVLPPTGVALADAKNSGAKTDNLTNFNNSSAGLALQFDVTGGATGASILIYAGDVLIGTASAASPVTVTTDGFHALADGDYEITATQVLFGFESEPSAVLPITIDATPPADITSVAPVIARPGEPYEYDPESLDQDEADVTLSLIGEPAGMDITPEGVITWTPGTEQQGVHEFEIRFTDDAGNYVSESVLLTVLGEPPAYPDHYEVNEDEDLSRDATTGVLANDGDDQSGLEGTVTLVSDVSHGELVLHESGSFTYTPDTNFFGTDMFTYMVTTAGGDTNEAPVTITVLPVNDAPVAVADSYVVAEDQLLVVTLANGLLKNDSDVDDDHIIASVIDWVEHGTLTPNSNGNGTFTYQPNANFSGTDTFTYWASDSGQARSEEVTVTINVTAVNDAPVVVDSEHDVLEDGELTVDAPGVLAGATDVEEDELTAEVVDGPDDGTLTLNPDGSFTYKPNGNFYGSDSFTFRASDNTDWSEAATVTINVQPQGDPPTAEDDEYDVTGGDTVVLDVRENDTTDPPDGDQEFLITAVTQGSHGGKITISPDKKTVNYTPASAFSATETFDYTITDEDGLTSTATVTVNVANWQGVISGYVYCDSDNDGVRDAGEANVPGALIRLTGVDDQGKTVEKSTVTSSDGSYVFSQLAPGTYEIREQQPVALEDGKDTIGSAGGKVANDHFSEIVITAQGESVGNNFGEGGLKDKYFRLDMLFVSAPSLQESLAEIILQAEEEAGNADVAAQIRASKNEAPTAAADAYDAVENGGLDITATAGVLANDSDPDGSPPSPLTSLAITEINYSPADPTTVELAVDSSFTADDFEFVELKNVGSMTLDLAGVEFTEGIDFSFAGGDVAELGPGETVLVVSDLSAFEARYKTGQRVAGEFAGTLSDGGERIRLVDALGSAIHDFVYDDAGGWPAQAAGDGKTLEVLDVAGDYGDPLNWTASSALNGSPGAAANTAAAVDRLMALLVDGPDHGDLVLDDDGSFSYTPDDDFVGVDRFTYRASDGTDLSEETEVTIEVKASGS